MSSKGSKSGDRGRGGGGQARREEVERLIAKGKLKDAVKQAKLCHRDEPTPEHHRLLERASLLRAEQLHRGGMANEAREVAHHLVEFGITDPDLIASAAELLVAVGLPGRAMELQRRLGGAPESGGRLLRQAADQAVLHPDRALPELRAEALKVREALDALASGDEERARSSLADVARASPFAEWRLFVRGLAASRRDDLDERRASWDRLDPDRAPSRIARALTALDGPGPEGAGGVLEASPNLEAIERRAFGEPVLGPLRKLGAMVAQDRWDEVVRMLAPLRSSLRRIDPALAVRLTAALYDPFIRAATHLGYHEARRLIRAFVGAAEPLPIDPRWNRLWAIAWEGPQGDPDEAEPFWRKYLKDLETSTALRDEERPTAQALVWYHLGRLLVDDAGDLEASGALLDSPRGDAEVLRIRRRAVECLEESIRLCPTLRASYQALIDAHRDWGQPEEAAAVGRRLLEALPDDFDTLMDLAAHHFRRDDPAQSLEYAQRARALRPLDEEAAGSEWAARVALARQHALARRFDEARAELDAAGRIRPDSRRSVHFLARKAVLELKAGRDDRAGELIAEAQALLPEPAPLWLALLIEARRYKLPKPKREPFEDRWAEALSARRRGETAAALADLLAPFVEGDVPYTGRQTHVRQVLDYIRKTTRLKYRREDLAAVCRFLGLVPRERKLLETMAGRGDRLFPDAPEFPMMLGATEMEKGPFRADLRKARRHFERALGIAESQAPADSRAAELVPKLREALTGLEDVASGPMGFPFSLPNLKDLPPELLDLIGSMDPGPDGPFDDDFDDLFGDMFEDEDDFDGEAGPPPAAPRPRHKAPRKKRKKKG